MKEQERTEEIFAAGKGGRGAKKAGRLPHLPASKNNDTRLIYSILALTTDAICIMSMV